MEEIEYKLKGNNGILIAHTIAKILDIIKTKLIAHQSVSTEATKEIPELQLLKQKCSASETIINLTACQGIIHLVKEGFLPIAETIDFIVGLAATKNCTGICQGIVELLLFDMKNQLKTNTYKTDFNLTSLQHPMVSILRQNQDIWPNIVNQMEFLCNHHDQNIALNSLKMLRTVFVYTLCNPNSNLPDNCRIQVWEMMLRLSTNSNIKKLIEDLLPWIQFPQSLKSFSYVNLVNTLYTQSNVEICSGLLPYLASIAHEVTIAEQDPRPCLTTIANIRANTHFTQADNYILLILCDIVFICPSVYLENVIQLCAAIVKRGGIHFYTKMMLVASCLQWLAYPSQVINSTLEVIHQTIEYIYCTEDTFNSRDILQFSMSPWFMRIQNIDSRVYLSKYLLILSDNFDKKPELLGKWLLHLHYSPVNIIKQFITFIFGIFLNNTFANNIIEQALKLILKLVQVYNDYATTALTILLHKLSKTKNHPKLQFMILKSIPSMGIVKENIPLILHTIESFENGPSGLQLLSIDLYMRLWKVEIRCYPRLQKVLILSPKDNETMGNFDIVKAVALKQLCTERPELYGTELVSQLADLLSRNISANGSLASSLALQGICALCKAGIVDIASTWNVLSPKLAKDKRLIVVKSLCELLGTVPALQSLTEPYDTFTAEVIAKLWNYVLNSDNKDVNSSALKALANFNLDLMSLKDVPSVYRQNLKIPNAKTPLDASRKPEDVLLYIPGECWIQLLENINLEASDAVCKLITHWTDIEISQYRSKIYMVPEGQGEPSNYTSLPHKSIIRALGDYVRRKASKTLINTGRCVLLPCLQILTQNYEKPLPPLNWCFLHELFHLGDEEKKYCIILAAKQSLNSGSAKRLIENYLSSFDNFDNKEDEIITIYSVLPFLCRSIEPNILRGPINVTLKYALINYQPREKYSDSLFYKLIQYLKETFLDNSIHDANRTLLAMLVESLFEQIEYEHVFFTAYVDCVVELPQNYLERLTSPSVWWETTEEKLRKSILIRCELSKRRITDTPLVWLNECIDAVLTCRSEQINMLRSLADILIQYREDKTSVNWYLQLMGRIQTVMIEKPDSTEQIEYLCDVFMVVTIVFSAHDTIVPIRESIIISRECRMSLLPQATLQLLTTDNWKQILSETMEFYFHMTTSTSVSKLYLRTFKISLISLKSTEYYQKQNVWMRYLSAICCTNS